METLNQLDTMASELLKKMPEMLQKGAEYGGDLFVRFIKYSLITNYIYMILNIIVVIFIVYISNKIFRFLYKQFKEEDDNYIIGIILYSVLVIFVFIRLIYCFFESLENIIQLHTIPEIYIINYFK